MAHDLTRAGSRPRGQPMTVALSLADVAQLLRSVVFLPESEWQKHAECIEGRKPSPHAATRDQQKSTLKGGSDIFYLPEANVKLERIFYDDAPPVCKTDQKPVENSVGHGANIRLGGIPSGMSCDVLRNFVEDATGLPVTTLTKCRENPLVRVTLNSSKAVEAARVRLHNRCWLGPVELGFAIVCTDLRSCTWLNGEILKLHQVGGRLEFPRNPLTCGVWTDSKPLGDRQRDYDPYLSEEERRLLQATQLQLQTPQPQPQPVYVQNRSHVQGYIGNQNPGHGAMLNFHIPPGVQPTRTLTQAEVGAALAQGVPVLDAPSASGAPKPQASTMMAQQHVMQQQHFQFHQVPVQHQQFQQVQQPSVGAQSPMLIPVQAFVNEHGQTCFALPQQQQHHQQQLSVQQLPQYHMQPTTAPTGFVMHPAQTTSYGGTASFATCLAPLPTQQVLESANQHQYTNQQPFKQPQLQKQPPSFMGSPSQQPVGGLPVSVHSGILPLPPPQQQQ